MRVQHKRLIRVILALVHICISPSYQQKFTKPKQLDGTNIDECDTIRINKNLYGYNIRLTKAVIEDGNTQMACKTCLKQYKISTLDLCT